MSAEPRLGAVFPQLEIGSDPGAVRAFAQGVEALGLHHLHAYDHVVGADPAVHTGWTGFYDHRDPFHEPFVLFGHLAGLCSLELATGILILPQRQTVLVAKQAAEVDLLSGGRLRLGVGLGWNEVEFEALGEDFSTRGARIEEQVALLRELWTTPSVTFEGEHHRVVGAAIAPLPVQRPIPLWMGAGRPAALRRVGRVADGWIPLGPVDDALRDALGVIADAARAAGRDPRDIGLDGRIRYGDGDLRRVRDEAAAWVAVGASHITVHTLAAGLTGVDAHLDALAAARDAVREATGP